MQKANDGWETAEDISKRLCVVENSKNVFEVVKWVLSRVKNATPDGITWKAACPCHEDKELNLTVSLAGKNLVRLECRKGCETHAIATALESRSPATTPDKIPLGEAWSLLDLKELDMFAYDGSDAIYGTWWAHSAADISECRHGAESVIGDRSSKAHRGSRFEWYRGQADGYAWAVAAAFNPHDVTIPPLIFSEDAQAAAMRHAHNISWADAALHFSFNSSGRGDDK